MKSISPNFMSHLEIVSSLEKNLAMIQKSYSGTTNDKNFLNKQVFHSPKCKYTVNKTYIICQVYKYKFTYERHPFWNFWC